ncbi:MULTISPECIES: hypothetical protein [unclassified Arthrobacter]|uniref:hypothetical protein n=1 Tax=unclassified Arthrobacter TaxID=235627 RepID=UPI001D15D580|nr:MULTISPECIES: hypothetical protein [unclassified Arthrobacter]MCC3275783.1 hypothetical protein [Arthrobacter sp. zg-Y20]MCC3278792.1 hypothetical protein [Arthrobacter sp. zg-Y40]MCC9177166.1 hypothetical protein [Arthrobacter sp. zg-Y750]MDK1315940.1 hypothetical protein [Arthrobacter sp. zg.Y20]MDK1326135.1 hypothetical protein [Arthrobacter sp. zg-Y1143]
MEYVEVLLPSVCVAALFYFVMKALLNSDRAERKALAEAEREVDQSVDQQPLKKTGEEEN